MNDCSVRVSHNDLYEKVWSQSVSSLAKEMGISEVEWFKIDIDQDGLKTLVKLKNRHVRLERFIHKRITALKCILSFERHLLHLSVDNLGRPQ